MLVNLLGLLILFFLTIFFAWLVIRTVRLNRSRLKWPALIASGLIAILFGVVTFLTAKGLYAFYAPIHMPVPEVAVEGTADQVAQGEHIASFTCVNCHSLDDNLPLTGGADLNRESPIPIGPLIPYNLTPGGPLKDWNEAEIFRAVRNGVDKDGRPLIAMANLPFRNLSDADILAVAAYLKRQSATVNEIQGGDSPNLLFAFFAGAGLLPKMDPVPGSLTSPAKGPTPEYGQYIVRFLGCRDCHGPDLSGGKGGAFAPVGPNLRIVKTWSKEQFIQTIRTGRDPYGHALDQVKMHWKDYAHMNDDDLTALYLYVTSLASNDQ